ncbi:adenosylcobinamide-GDP ribazoletransferase [Psychromarinibacter sp. C21-152]|uniref:Adenosylcobinamide-GDP ribazoletransferase n=1 Tax=Psychromarinibacter sediminicola TaxID=3033385 RepID=A0AAE3NQU2_9RHOB|nr:adenosylcobinamide-GDP ribazoletransferase [Psychromarinibacter sediminicola]MDF0600386.1 adenosylcobinamide-GDP ribazoletransferase [Psychromarinibacter sediminicola]
MERTGRNPALAVPGDIGTALALLTRLPLPALGGDRGAAAAWAWPLAGLAVGLIAAVAGGMAAWLGLPDGVTAGLVLAASVVVTGALHEDGLADVADGLWGGAEPARRLEIMKDSRIGSYGVIALVLSLGLRWAALAEIVGTGGLAASVLAAAMLSRAPMAVLMAELPPARADGLSRHVGRPARATVALGLLLALAAALVLLGAYGLAVCAVTAMLALGCAAIARAKLGGQTGDVLGATQQICEIAVLALCAAAV